MVIYFLWFRIFGVGVDSTRVDTEGDIHVLSLCRCQVCKNV